MFNVEITYSESFYKKLNPSVYVQAEEECVKNSTMEAEEGCISEAPVRTGKLRDGHYTEIEGMNGRVMNDVEYAPYVVYGTSRQPANNYPQRVANEMSGGYGDKFVEALRNNGVDI